MSNFKDLLAQFGQQETEETPVQVPLQSAPVLPENYNQLAAQEEEYVAPTAPVRAPAVEAQAPNTSNETMTKLKTTVSGTLPSTDTKTSEGAEERLERLMRELDVQRKKERDEASSRQFKANIVKALTEGVGGIVGGAQAMNTKAAVNPIQTKGFDVGDLVGQVDKRFAGDREALLDQYKQLLNARDKGEQRKYQQEQLEVMREGNKIKKDIAQIKADAKGEGLTPGQESQDKDFGKINNEWTTTGRSKFDSNLKKLEDVAAELENLPASAKNSDDRFVGRLPDVFQSEEDINRREMVRAAAQETLRATLGSQFTEKEGVSIMNRAYDPTLSPASNLKRIKGIIAELKQSRDANDARSKEFESKGTLSKLQTSGSRQNTISNVDAPVERLDKASGKIALFDPKTKQFLKFKD